MFAHNFQNIKGTMEDMEDEGNFLRRSVNDITSLLDINFGSLGRPSRGGRGRGARGGPTSRPERARPILERVGSHLFGETDYFHIPVKMWDLTKVTMLCMLSFCH